MHAHAHKFNFLWTKRGPYIRESLNYEKSDLSENRVSRVLSLVPSQPSKGMIPFVSKTDSLKQSKARVLLESWQFAAKKVARMIASLIQDILPSERSPSRLTLNIILRMSGNFEIS